MSVGQIETLHSVHFTLEEPMVNDIHHNGCALKSPTAQKYMDVEITSSLDWSFHINSNPIIRLLGFSETPQALHPNLKSLSTKPLKDLKWSTAAEDRGNMTSFLQQPYFLNLRT